MTYQQAIQQACESVGSQAGLAKAIEVAPAIVHQWRSGTRPVPVQHCLAIERATAGTVTRRYLRPDDWQKIWPELAEPTAQEVSHG